MDSFFKSLVEQLNHIDFSQKILNKSYYELYKQLKKHVKEEYGLNPKGSIQEEYLSYGIVFGLLIGSAFIAINPAFIAIGLPIGVALGLSLGTSKEKNLRMKKNYIRNIKKYKITIMEKKRGHYGLQD